MAISNTVAGICAQLLRIILTLTRPFSDYVLDILYLLFMGKTKSLPPIEDKVLLMSATDLAEKIRKRQLKCEYVMQAYVQRSRAVHPFINAAVDARYEDALVDAKAIDHFLESGEKSEEDIERDTPLLGVPFSCKEVHGVKGLAETCGLVWAKGRKANKDGADVVLYRKAGAIPVTVTNVPETCMWWEASNLIYGRTKNPYNHARTVGGSSGGEGAIITSCGAVIGLGSDIGGSVRIPACFCGIYGHKPSPGIVPIAGMFPYDEIGKYEAVSNFQTKGPLCRYAEDLLPLMKVLTDHDKRINFNEKVNFHDVKIYYIEEIPGLLNKSVLAIKNAVKKAANYFEDYHGVKPISLKLDELEYGFSIWESKLLESGIPSLKELLEWKSGKINLWSQFLKSLLRCADHSLPAIYFAMVGKRDKDQFYHDCLKKLSELERKFQEIFEEDAIVLMPTHPEPPPHHLMAIPKMPNFGYVSIFNILGLPSTQIPAGLCEGLPIGIQAISGRFKDHLTIATGVELDKVFGGWKSPCAINLKQKT